MPTIDEALGKRGVWLLDITVAGQLFRFSDIRADVATDDGDSLPYVGGLDPVSWSMASAGLDASLGVTIRSDVDWAGMVGRGVAIERSKGVLRRWFPGQTLERARVILRGLVQRVEYGATHEPLTFSLATLPLEQSDTIPPSQALVSDETWPLVQAGFDSKIAGAAYPIIIGQPGSGAFPATPGLMVDLTSILRTSKLMIAGHRVQATEVTIYDLTDTPEQAVRPVQEVKDGLGRLVSFVDFTGAPPPSLRQAPDRKWYVGWDVGQGGLKRDTELLRGAGDVLLYFLEHFTRIPVDRGRMVSQTARLNAYKIDAYINKAVNAWQWLQREVIPLLPVIQRETSDGLFFQYINWRATSTDAVRRLDAGSGQIERSGPVRTTGGDVYNEVTVSYAPFATSQRYRRRRVVTAKDGKMSTDPVSGTDSRVSGSYLAQVSQAQFGVRPLEVQSSAVWDDATASRIAQDKIAELAIPKRAIAYTAGPELEGLEVGSVVLLNDPEVAIIDEPAILMDVVVGAGQSVALTLVVLDQQVRAP